jgi:hypothetical protein
MALKRKRWVVSAVVVAVAVPTMWGCRDSRRLPPAPWKAEPGPVTVDGRVLDQESPPGLVVDTFFDLIARSISIRRAGIVDARNASAFDEVQRQIWRIAAAEAIHARAVSRDLYRMLPKGLSAERAVEMIAGGWPAIVGHYIDGVDRATMSEQSLGDDGVLVTVIAENPDDRRILDEVRSALAGQRDIRGRPLEPGTETYDEHLRRAALDRGVCPPITAKIEVTLVREAGCWRVADVHLGPQD